MYRSNSDAALRTRKHNQPDGIEEGSRRCTRAHKPKGSNSIVVKRKRNKIRERREDFDNEVLLVFSS